MATQVLSSVQGPNAESLMGVHARKLFQQQQLQEVEKAANLNPCLLQSWCSEAQETKWQSSPTRSRMTTTATETAFESDHCDFTDSDSCKTPTQEPEDFGGSDDKSSTDEGSIMPQACGVEASEDASELADCFDGPAAPTVEASATSYNRSFLLSVNANLSRHIQHTSAPPSGSVTLPKAKIVQVKCPPLSLASSASKRPAEVYPATGSPAKATSRGVQGKQTESAKQTESVMTVDSPKQSTIMLRNIPNRVSCAAITQQLEAHGFGGTYDLVYVPIDRTSGNLNLGYAFVNFREKENCSLFRDAFNGKRAKVLFPNSSSDKVLTISLASVQGRDAYWKRLYSFVWPVGSEAWQPLIYDDNGKRIRLSSGQPHIAPADIKNSEGAAAAACNASRKSSSLRAEAPEFVPTTVSPTSGETDYNVPGVLDHPWTPSCDAQFHGAPGLTCDASMCHYQSPIFDCCSIQPELHMASFAKATQYAQSQSKQTDSQCTMGLMSLDPPNTTHGTVAAEVLATRCEQQSQERTPAAEEQPTTAVISKKSSAADVSSRPFRFVAAAAAAAAFVTGFLSASSLGLTGQSVVSSGLAACQSFSRP